MQLKGVWLPIITPFLHDEVDYDSYRKLLNDYIAKGISGIMPLGTTGEAPTVLEYEFEKIVETTVATVNKRVPVFVGVGGNFTKKVIKTLKVAEKYPIQGILSVCPYYNLPSQHGIFQHFLQISEATDLDIVIYNIPYRTGRNIENDTMLELAALKNIVGVKDSCGDVRQTMRLLSHKPDNFSVLTGEDILFYTTLVHGGDGGILAASHLKTEQFLEVFRLVEKNNHQAALQEWWELAEFIPFVFQEPNPGPLKYCLKQQGLITSDETRLPITTISGELQEMLDKCVI
jgi:4-hydroxy-tetrahydrodipicolinate synthase